MDRYVCVHGHFYQPPRENPWLESIELQDSAAPYHDWNERVTAECYAPNARSRILDGEGRIASIVNNYARISFNFGPTLLAWMEHRAPDVYHAVLRADRESADRFGGHGSALAQAYNHMIMPLANPRDRRTQIHWGIRDFVHRFGREPEGMWLPETAVDVETLDALAREGIAFTVLAPHQAHRVRPRGARKWDEVGGEGVDTTVPYRVRLSGGRSIAVFFYDGPVSQAVAFEALLGSGERFADRLLGAFPDQGAERAGDRPDEGPDEGGQAGSDQLARLVHIATDGETYGHHHRHGDMALAYALELIEQREGVRLTNYSEFLELRPPEHEAEIAADTSWSCAHGVGRWQSDCGCNTGRGWHQRWRGPLREALDWLRGTVEPLFEDRGAKVFTDPWVARDDYVEVVLDRSPGRVSGFLERHAGRELDEGERIDALKLLELQRHAMLMYTSCGWFFDDLSGIETVQVLQYAARAIQLAQEIGDEPLEEEFLARLEQAESNIPEHATGREVYEHHVRPSMVDLTKVAAHYAATSLFEEQPEPAPGAAPMFGGYAEEAPRVYCYEVEPQDHQVFEAGRTRLALGRIHVVSEVTRERAEVSYGALHFGDHNLNAAARAFLGPEAYREMVDDVREAFDRADLPEVVRRLDGHFGRTPYSLRTLFRDEQRRVLDVILGAWLQDAEAAYRQLFERQAPLIHFLADLGVPLPEPFRENAEMVVDARLLEQFSTRDCDPDMVRELLADTATWRLELDVAALAFALSRTVAGVATDLRRRPQSGKLLARLEQLVDLAHGLPWEVELAETQTLFYDVLHETYERLRERGDAEATVKADRIRRIGEKLAIRVP